MTGVEDVEYSQPHSLFIPTCLRRWKRRSIPKCWHIKWELPRRKHITQNCLVNTFLHKMHKAPAKISLPVHANPIEKQESLYFHFALLSAVLELLILHGDIKC